MSQSYARETLMFHSVAPDLIPQDAPVDTWDIGNNVVFRNNESLRVFGDAPTLPGIKKIPRTCVFMTGENGQGYWLYANPFGVWVHDGAVETDITPANWFLAFDPTTVWTSCVLNGIGYINASDRDPVYWNGDPAQKAQPLPDWPTDGRTLALRAHKNFLFGIGFISEGGQRVRWSDAAEAGTVPQSWTPAADNLAGFVDLAPLFSPCLDGKTLRDSLLVYKQESVWSFDFVGGNIVFAIRKLFSEHGIAATNAVTGGIDDVHLFVGDDGDVFIHDGVRVQSILDGRAQRTFYADFTVNVDRVFSAATLAREKLGFIIYPGSSESAGTRALMYDFTSGDIGFRDMPEVACAAEGAKLIDPASIGASWDSDLNGWDTDATAWLSSDEQQTLDDVIVGGEGGFFAISDSSANDFSAGPIQAFLSKTGLSMGDPQRRKMLMRLWPKVTGQTGDTLQFRLGGQEVAGGPIALSPPVTFTIGQDRSIDTFVQGRFINLQVTSMGGAPWRIGSIDFEYKMVGDW